MTSTAEPTLESLRDNGISEALAIELMNEHYNVPGVCEPEWEIEDLTKKISNAYTYANLSKIGGKTAEAESCHARAFAILERAIGPDLPELSESLSKSAILGPEKPR